VMRAFRVRGRDLSGDVQKCWQYRSFRVNDVFTSSSRSSAVGRFLVGALVRPCGVLGFILDFFKFHDVPTSAGKSRWSEPYADKFGSFLRRSGTARH
jgi:hypothetical protein